METARLTAREKELLDILAAKDEDLRIHQIELEAQSAELRRIAEELTNILKDGFYELALIMNRSRIELQESIRLTKRGEK